MTEPNQPPLDNNTEHLNEAAEAIPNNPANDDEPQLSRDERLDIASRNVAFYRRELAQYTVWFNRGLMSRAEAEMLAGLRRKKDEWKARWQAIFAEDIQEVLEGAQPQAEQEQVPEDGATVDTVELEQNEPV